MQFFPKMEIYVIVLQILFKNSHENGKLKTKFVSEFQIDWMNMQPSNQIRNKVESMPRSTPLAKFKGRLRLKSALQVQGSLRV